MRHLKLLTIAAFQYPGTDFSLATSRDALPELIWTDGPTAQQVFKKVQAYWSSPTAPPQFRMTRHISPELAAHIVHQANKEGRHVFMLPQDNGDTIFCGTPSDAYHAQAIANRTGVWQAITGEESAMATIRALSGQELKMRVPVRLWGNWADRMIEAGFTITGVSSCQP